MERKFLEGLGLEKEIIDRVLDQHSTEIGRQKQALEAMTTERDGLKGQLEEATAEIKSHKDVDVDGIKAKVDEWEAKYNADTQALKGQLEATSYGFAVKDAVAGLKFTSESAKKAFVAELTAKKLPLQEEKLLGLEDFRKTYQESDPGAFVPEDDDKILVATRGGTGGGATMGADAALRAAMGLPEQKD